MRKIIPIVLVALMLFWTLGSMHEKIDGIKNNALSAVIQGEEAPTFALYTSNMELNLSDFGDLQSFIKGKGFDLKTIDTLSFVNLEHVDVLILPTTQELSDKDILIIEQYMYLSGGKVLCILPQDPDTGLKEFLEDFGIKILGMVKDNVSYFKNETSVVLNGTWLTNISIMRNINQILYVNGSALNVTEPKGFFEKLNISQTNFTITENETVDLFQYYNILWGNNSTYVEYQKDKYLNGTNLSLLPIFELWWGAKLIVVSSPYMFADKFLHVPGYNNTELLKAIIMFLGGEINSVDIKLVDLEPNVTPINLKLINSISWRFEAKIFDVSKNGYDGSNIDGVAKAYVGIIYLEKFIHVAKPEITFQYNETQDVLVLNMTGTFNLSKYFNRSVLISLKALVISRFYGYIWSEEYKLELYVPKISVAKWDPIMLTFGVIILIGIIAMVAVAPQAFKAKKQANEIYEQIKSKQ